MTTSYNIAKNNLAKSGNPLIPAPPLPKEPRQLFSRTELKSVDDSLICLEEEIFNNSGKNLIKAKLYRIAYLICLTLTFAITTSIPIGVFLGAPFWIPLVISFVGGTALSLGSRFFKNKQEAILQRSKKLSLYKEQLLRYTSDFDPLLDKYSENSKSENFKKFWKSDFILQKMGKRTKLYSKKEHDLLEKGLGLESRLFFKRHQIDSYLDLSLSAERAWGIYKNKVISAKAIWLSRSAEEAIGNLEQIKFESLIHFSNINPNILPFSPWEDNVQQIRSLLGFGLQVLRETEDQCNTFDEAFLGLEFLRESWPLDAKMKEFRKESLNYSKFLQKFFVDLGEIKTEKELFLMLQKINQFGVISSSQVFIKTALNMQKQLSEKILSHPKKKLELLRHLLILFEEEISNPEWGTEWFNEKESLERKNYIKQVLNQARNSFIQIEENYINVLEVERSKILVNSIENTLADIPKKILESNVNNEEDFKTDLQRLKSSLEEVEATCVSKDLLARNYTDFIAKMKTFESQYIENLEDLVFSGGLSIKQRLWKAASTRASTIWKRKEDAITKGQLREKEDKISRIKQNNGVDLTSEESVNVFKTNLEVLNQHAEQLRALCTNLRSSINENKNITVSCKALKEKLISLEDGVIPNAQKACNTVLFNQIAEENKDGISLGEVDLEILYRKANEKEETIISRAINKQKNLLNNLLTKIDKGIFSRNLSKGLLSLLFTVVCLVLGTALYFTGLSWAIFIVQGLVFIGMGVGSIFSCCIEKKSKIKKHLEVQKNMLDDTEVNIGEKDLPSLKDLKSVQDRFSLDSLQNRWAKEVVKGEDERISGGKEFSLNEARSLMKGWQKEIKKIKTKPFINNYLDREGGQQDLLAHKFFAEEGRRAQSNLMSELNSKEKELRQKEALLDDVVAQLFHLHHEKEKMRKEELNFQEMSNKALKSSEENFIIESNKQKKVFSFISSALGLKLQDLKTEENINAVRESSEKIIDIFNSEKSEKEKKEELVALIKSIPLELLSSVRDYLEILGLQDVRDDRKRLFTPNKEDSTSQRGFNLDMFESRIPLIEEAVDIISAFQNNNYSTQGILNSKREVLRVSSCIELLRSVSKDLKKEAVPFVGSGGDLDNNIGLTEEALGTGVLVSKLYAEKGREDRKKKAKGAKAGFNSISSYIKKLICHKEGSVENIILPFINNLDRKVENEDTEKQFLEKLKKLPTYHLKELQDHHFVKWQVAASSMNESLAFKNRLEAFKKNLYPLQGKKDSLEDAKQRRSLVKQKISGRIFDLENEKKEILALVNQLKIEREEIKGRIRDHMVSSLGEGPHLPPDDDKGASAIREEKETFVSLDRKLSLKKQEIKKLKDKLDQAKDPMLKKHLIGVCRKEIKNCQEIEDRIIGGFENKSLDMGVAVSREASLEMETNFLKLKTLKQKLQTTKGKLKNNPTEEELIEALAQLKKSKEELKAEILRLKKTFPK